LAMTQVAESARKPRRKMTQDAGEYRQAAQWRTSCKTFANRSSAAEAAPNERRTRSTTDKRIAQSHLHLRKKEKKTRKEEYDL
jgi:hypothetical protein